MHAPSSYPKRLLNDADHARLHSAAQTVFASEPWVVAVYLYGSAARGEAAADLDIAVLSEERAPVHRLEPLAADLQAQGAPAGPEIDLRPLWGAAPRFQVNVLKEGRLLYDPSPRVRWRLEAQIASRWADFRPTWLRMRARMRERWLRGPPDTE